MKIKSKLSLNKEKILSKIRRILFNKPLLITVLSALSFIVPALIDGLILRKKFDWTGNIQSLVMIGVSLVTIIFNLIIVKKWFSWKEVGLQKSGFLKSLLYSLVFVTLLRVFNHLGHKEIFNQNILHDKAYLFYLFAHIILAFEEELMFRGVILKAWEKQKGFLLALFISSILFGLEHLLYPAMGFEQVTAGRAIIAALFGPAFTLIAYRTGNIWGLTLSHFLYNVSILITEPIAGVTDFGGVFIMPLFGLSIFFPILIDLADKKLFKTKRLNIVWSKYLATLFLIFFLLLTLFFASEDLGWTQNEQQFCPYLENEKARACINENSKKIAGCYGIDLRLDEANEKLEENQKALEIIRDNCLWLSHSVIHDFTGDGEKEVAMITSPAGCTNCHNQQIYIIQDNEIIFEKDTEDVWFWPAENHPGFIIKYPLRKQGEMLCCPSEGIVESYTVSKIDSDYKTFYKFDEHYEPY